MLSSILLQAGVAHESFTQFLAENIQVFLSYTGFANATPGHFIMLLVGLLFIFMAIKYEFEPMLLIPIGFGILIGNIPFKDAGLQLGIYEEGSVFNILYQGVKQGWYPPLIYPIRSCYLSEQPLSLVSSELISLRCKWDSTQAKPELSVSSVVLMVLLLSSCHPSWLQT